MSSIRRLTNDTTTVSLKHAAGGAGSPAALATSAFRGHSSAWENRIAPFVFAAASLCSSHG